MNEVRLTIAPRWNGETVSAAAVRMTLSLPVRAGEPLFRIRVQSIDKPFAALSDDALASVPKEIRDRVRAGIFKTVILKLI